MPTLDDTKVLITALPAVTERTRCGRRTSFVDDRGFAVAVLASGTGPPC